MSIQISHLRRWFAGGAIGLLLVVAAVYFYARHKSGERAQGSAGENRN